MNQLRLDADTATAKAEELSTKVKSLEQENLAKEQEITSLQHKNNVLEGQVEKLEGDIDKFKKIADEGSGSLTQNETLQRRLQLLEDEAEEADKTLREANEKYVFLPELLALATPYFSTQASFCHHDTSLPLDANLHCFPTLLGSDRPMLRPAISSERYKPSRVNATSGSPSTRRWRRSTTKSKRSSRTSSARSALSKLNGIMSLIDAHKRRRYAGYKNGKDGSISMRHLDRRNSLVSLDEDVQLRIHFCLN